MNTREIGTPFKMILFLFLSIRLNQRDLAAIQDGLPILLARKTVLTSLSQKNATVL